MNARRALQSTGNASGPTASDSTGLRQELLKDLKSAENPEKRNLIVGALQRIDADDTFFASVMETYAGLVRAGLDANRVQLLREVLASVPKEDLQDAALLEALKEATASGNIVKVLERAAQLARARAERKAEDAWRKELAQCNADCVDKPKCAERCGSDADCKGRCGSQPKCQAYCEGQHPKPK